MAPKPKNCWKERLGTGVALLFVGWFYWFTVASAGGFNPNGEFDYHNLQAEGWRRGQLSLPVVPDPRLVALENPYEPTRNRDYRLPDASYYQGRYYIYFGPAPAAVLLLPYRLLTGSSLPQGTAVLTFCLAGIGAASVLWLGIRRRYFPESAWWTAGMGILLLGLGAHVLALARRPYMWELSIAASHAFTMIALLCASRVVHGRRPVAAMGLAGLALGLAMAARPPALLAAVLLAPPLWWLWKRRGPWLAGGIAAAAALGAIAVLLLWYNHARFGSVWEFGQKYQLTGLNESNSRHFSLDYAWHNVRLYFFWPVQWTLSWPFVAARPLPPAPDGYYAGEDVYWLAVLFPVIWFAPAGLLAWVRIRSAERGELRVILASVAGAGLALGALIMCFFSATERYMVEFVPAMMLLALGGALGLEQAAGPTRWRAWLRAGFALAGGVTVMAGILASFDYHHRIMARTDPVAWDRITKTVARLQRSLGWRTPYAVARHLQEWVGSQDPGTVRRLPRASDRAGGDDFLFEVSQEGLCRLGESGTPEAVRWGDWFDPHEPGPTVMPGGAATSPGGSLAVRLFLPDLTIGAAEPLLVLGRQHAADVLMLRRVGSEHWQVQLDHWAHPLMQGPRVRLERGKWYELRIQFPSFSREAFGRQTTGEVIVTADGEEVFRVNTPVYAFDAATMDLGRNRIGATTCRPAFTGWILQAQWVGE